MKWSFNEELTVAWRGFEEFRQDWRKRYYSSRVYSLLIRSPRILGPANEVYVLRIALTRHQAFSGNYKPVAFGSGSIPHHMNPEYGCAFMQLTGSRTRYSYTSQERKG
jgi:hypothetical protein